MDFFQTVFARQSTRAFSAERLPKESLQKILAAGCAAPVGRGAYGNLRLTVLQKPALLEKISAATGGDKAGAPLYGAPTLILVSSPASNNLEYANAACVVENMHLAATALGLGSVYLWGFLRVFSDAALLAELGLPEGFRPVSALGAGYAVESKERKPAPGIETSYIR